MNISRAFPVFSAAFAVSYALAVVFNLALFTYHPQLKQFAWLVEAPKAGPAMYWYGWIVTSTVAALATSAIALALPPAWTARIWPGFAWFVPAVVMVFFVYLLRGYFLR